MEQESVDVSRLQTFIEKCRVYTIADFGVLKLVNAKDIDLQDKISLVNICEELVKSQK